MWLSDRRNALKLLAGASLAGVAACGFTPVYAPGGTGMRLQGRVGLPDPNSEESYQLIRELETRLGRATSPAFDLELTLRVTEDRMAVTSDNITTRFHVVGRLAYVLRDAATGQQVTRGEVENFTGYSATGSTVATTASRRDARERLMVILSDQLVTRLWAELPPEAGTSET